MVSKLRPLQLGAASVVWQYGGGGSDELQWGPDRPAAWVDEDRAVQTTAGVAPPRPPKSWRSITSPMTAMTLVQIMEAPSRILLRASSRLL